MSLPPHDDLEINVVTGAFSYTGKYIAQRLLSMGKSVTTLTNHPQRPDPVLNSIQIHRYNFQDTHQLEESLRGATTLYNTYWLRFARGLSTFELAVENTETLIQAARAAGVRRMVHVSITNPSPDSELPYFRGKALVEQAIIGSGMEYAIIRPTLVFGAEDILLNNIAWFLRRFPIFPISGSGDYLVQPVYVEDLAELAVAAGQELLSPGNIGKVIDAAGPEKFTYRDFVSLVAQKVQSRAKIVHVPPAVLLGLATMMNLLVRDMVLTKDEIKGLMAGLLVSRDPPTCQTPLSRWLDQNRNLLGRRYASEIKRHYL
ncbi:MAG: epimerase [SAR202 cluster bacterium Io17-Chloro-G2]|nr:MAG: epimerase [SAR202 cluster bacterium Io17-Chloro-G2]